MSDPEWQQVISSNLDAWRYDPETKVLEIRFVRNMDVYSYDEVEESVATGLATAASVGQYFRNNIKDRYRFYRG